MKKSSQMNSIGRICVLLVCLLLFPMYSFLSCTQKPQDEKNKEVFKEGIIEKDGGIVANSEKEPHKENHSMVKEVSIDAPLQDCQTFPNDIPIMGLDKQEYACTDPNWKAGECRAGATTTSEDNSANHICLPNILTYSSEPPSSGDHRPMWGKWGEYKFIPPQRWLHNLEHGGVVLLYHPCADKKVIDELRSIAKERKPDDGGLFRWILTPYPKLKTTVAVVAWKQVYSANCVNKEEITKFFDEHYRKAGEDVDWDGSYEELWISR